jgi:RNA polymerase subunit RPABC4/transcription elongation factor Spt4
MFEWLFKKTCWKCQLGVRLECNYCPVCGRRIKK